MTTYDNSYSRFVAWAKVILPIMALGILSTLFLFSRNVDPTLSIPYAKVDVEGLAREQRIGAPNYAGMTEDGAAISIIAQAARPDPDNPNTVTATGLSATIEDASGGHISMTSNGGMINTEQQLAALQGSVQISTSTGYVINTSGLTAALNETSVITDGPITATGPLGTLNAGQMELKSQDDQNGSHLLVFKGGVKLIYNPKGL
ncbi:MAG: LPS export ABC transporter periplasmic protein LptC [Marinosulfonomonas sp.]|nr:LPS export ABC transporter periplasmic protein LptC [Marinosulfonomonas sp.]